MLRLLRTTLTLGLLCGAAVALPAPALAGSYTVWSCRGPAGEPLDAAAWSPFGDLDGGDTCARGGALTARLVPDDAGWHGDGDRHRGGGYRVAAPAGGAIVGYRVWRWTAVDDRDHPGEAWGHGDPYATVVEEPGTAVGGCFASSGCDTIGNPADPLAPANLVERDGVNLRRLAIAVGCSRWHCWHGSAELRLFRAALEVSDDVAPVGAGASAVAAAGGAIALPAHDDGAGLRAAEARVDGRPVASAGAPGCAAPYLRMAPCPADATFELAIDTSALPAGTHALAVVVSDAAGNSATLLTRTLAIPAAAQAVPGATAAPLADRLRVQRRRFATGAPGAIGGLALRRDGSAVPGTTVLVERRWYGPRGGNWRRAGTLTADAAGRFALPVPSEPQQLRFRLARPARAVSATVDVISQLDLSARLRPRTLRNGEVVAVSGRLAGAGRAVGGKQVQVQAIVNGRWQTVGRTQAGADERFRWRYRFKRTLRESLYSFRVRVAGDSARWPWPTLDSARMRVHVLP